LSPEELTCRELVELVTEYLDDALPAGERVRFDRHLEECEDCATYLAQFRTTIAMVGALRAEDVAAATCERLLEHFRGWTAAHPGDPG
jgi:anti-sigma factor RsiW